MVRVSKVSVTTSQRIENVLTVNLIKKVHYEALLVQPE